MAEPDRPLFIFDLDDVLYSFDWRARMAALSELTGLAFEELRARWWHSEGERAAEAGRFADADEYLAAFSAALGVPVTEVDWVRIRGAAMTPLPGSLAAVRRAKDRGRITLLTNNGPLTLKHLHRLAPELPPLFGPHLLTSSHYGARKPDPAVFERVLAAYATPAPRAFFADDYPPNVAAARGLGITAHLFTEPAALTQAIEDFAAGLTGPAG